MKSVSTFAIGMALALGVSASVGVMPAAAKPKEAKAAPAQLSQPVRDAVSAAMTAMGIDPKTGQAAPGAAVDAPTAAAKIAEAKAIASTPDEKYLVSQLSYQLGTTTKNSPQQLDGIEGMIQSGKVDAARLPSFYLTYGQLAYEAKSYQKAETALDQAIKLNTPELNAYALLAETKVKLGKSAEALAAIETAIAKQQAAGTVVPSSWYQRGIAIGYQAKLPEQTLRLTQVWLKAYPTPDNWRDSLITFRDLNKPDAEYSLDLERLMRANKALKGERDYYEYVEAVYLKFPGEAKSVIDEGVAAGALKLTPGSNTKMFSDTANKRIAADKADLASADKAARAAKTGVSARATADSFLGYGEFAKAADLYRVALQKGGVDASMVNTRLAMALARGGQKDAAKQALAGVTGVRAPLAVYIAIWIDQMA